MTRARLPRLLMILGLVLMAAPPARPAQTAANSAGPGFQTFVIGDESAHTPDPVVGGFLLNGGGEWNYDAFRWFTAHAGHGHIIVLRASGTTESQDEFYNDVKGILSVRTFLFTDRQAASDPAVLAAVKAADGIFIAGGDQSNYVRFWQDTPVQEALNRHIAAGKPIGGSSAGLAILGEFSFASIIDTIHSPEALADPYGNKVTISRDFLKIPLLADTITDTHFVKRDRLGRLLVFMARILQDGWAPTVRAIAVEENAAVLLETDGKATVVGSGPAYFLEAKTAPEICRLKTPLQFNSISVHRAPTASSFNVKSWSGQGGDDYVLSTREGQVSALGSTHGVY